MLHMTETDPSAILTSGDGPVAEVVNPGGKARVLLVCEHASPVIPSSLNDLGLAADDRYSHAVWDIGAADLARRLSALLDAPLVLARISRLVYDCNRPPEAPDSIPARTETIEVPGNRDLSTEARANRAAEVYHPFHACVSATLDRFNQPPALVTIHSFTPTWRGIARPTELGLLHDANPGLATAMLAATGPALRTDLNQPYSAADGVTHTLQRHANARDLENVMIEVRNDLLADADAIARIADLLQNMLAAALTQGIHAA